MFRDTSVDIPKKSRIERSSFSFLFRRWQWRPGKRETSGYWNSGGIPEKDEIRSSLARTK